MKKEFRALDKIAKNGIIEDKTLHKLLMVYFDNLRYGCNNAFVNNETMWNLETLKGKDDAGHSREGIFVINKSEQKGDIGKIDILDVAPTILKRMNMEIPRGFKGKIIN